MKTELLTVSKIFSENLFRIPDYQRGYSWEKLHLSDFWSDIEQLVEGKSHYTGVITLESVPASVWEKWEDDAWIIQSRRYTPYYVVDGQQRLTTITILLQCIIEATSESELNYTPIDTIKKKYIFDQKAGSMSRAYLFGYEKDNPSYEYLKTQIFCEQSAKHSTNEETIYTKNLKCAKKFFSEKLSKLDANGLETIFTKVTQQLVFNAYEIAKEIDVFVAFETMNNRGKPLSALELLKNRLIYLAAQMHDIENGEGIMLRRFINEAWKTVYHNLGKNDKRPLMDDEFLRTHFSLYYHLYISTDIPTDEDELRKFMARYSLVNERTSAFLLGRLFTRKRIEEETSEKLPEINSQTLEQYAAHLKWSIETYFKLSTPEQSDYTSNEKIVIERIGRLRGYDASPLLLAAFLLEKSGVKRLALITAFERCQFISTMRLGSSRMTYMNRHIHVEVIKFIKGKASCDDLISFYNNSVDDAIKEEALGESIFNWVKNGPGYYGWRSINYFLFEYELSLKEKSKSNRIKIEWDEFAKEDFQGDYVSVEHIYPQRAKSPYWTERFGKFNSTQKRLLRNSLGNLLALSTRKNSSLGNRPFPEKIGRDGELVGYRYGSYSENEVATYLNWGPADIVDRGVKMLTFMEERWNFKIGDANQKIKALGLGFLMKK